MTASGSAELDLQSQLLDIVVEEGMVDRDALTLDAELASLEIASVDFVMILMAIEEKFGAYIPVDEKLNDAKTVGDLLAVITAKIEAEKSQAAL